MTLDLIQQLLVDELGATRDGASYTLEAPATVTLLVEHRGGLMSVSKVRELVFAHEHVAVRTETDRHFFTHDAIFGLRQELRPADQRPGFR